MRKDHRAAIVSLLVISALLRLTWALTRPVDAESIARLPDQAGYLALARSLLRDGALSYTDERFGQVVYAVRTPGYPLFVAACGASVRGVRVAQSLVDTSTVLAIYLMARRLFGRRREAHDEEAGANDLAPLIAASFVAFDPFLIYFSSLVLSETLFTALLAWGMLLASAKARRNVFLGTALLALAVLVRPSALGLPIALCALGAFTHMHRRRSAAEDQPPERPSPSPARNAGVATILVLLILFPWAWRNSARLGEWVWSTSNDGITSYDGFNPAATGASDQRFVSEIPWLSSLTEMQRSRELGRLARQYVREHPGRAVQLAGLKLARTWSPYPLSEEYGRPLYIVVGLAFSLPFDLLVLWGLLRGNLSRRAKWFLACPALYFSLVHALSVGSLRYRIPAEPPLAIIAAAGAVALLSPSSSRETVAPR